MVSQARLLCLFQSNEVEDAKKNDTDEKTTRYSWRRSPETRPEDAKVRYCMLCLTSYFGLVLRLVDHTHKLVQYDEKGFRANCLHASGRLGLGAGERDMVSF